MATKIGILNGKGGVGKTTLSTNLASFIYLTNKKTGLVDTDPQGSARDWRSVQADNVDLPTVIGLDKPTLHKDLPGIESAFDYIIIDGASKTNIMDASIIKAVDLILIPIKPSIYDIWGAQETVELIKERQMITDGLPKAAFCITMNKENTKLANEIGEAVYEVGLPLFKSRINERELYKQSVPQGLTGFTCGRNQDREKVKNEISNLFDEIKEFTSQPA